MVRLRAKVSSVAHNSTLALNLEKNTIGLHSSSAFSEVPQDVPPPPIAEEKTPKLKGTRNMDSSSSSSEEGSAGSGSHKKASKQRDPTWVPETTKARKINGPLTVRTNRNNPPDKSPKPSVNSNPDAVIMSSTAPPPYLVKLLNNSGWKVESRDNPSSHVYVSHTGQAYMSYATAYEAFLGDSLSYTSTATKTQIGGASKDSGKKARDATMKSSLAAEKTEHIWPNEEPILKDMTTSQNYKGRCLEDDFNQMANIGNPTKENGHDASQSATLPTMKDKNKHKATSSTIANVDCIAYEHKKMDRGNSSCINSDVTDIKWAGRRHRSIRKHNLRHGVMALDESGSSPAAGMDKEKPLTPRSVLEERLPSLRPRCLNREATSSMPHNGDLIGGGMSDRIKGKNVLVEDGSDTQPGASIDEDELFNHTNRKRDDCQEPSIQKQNGAQIYKRNVKPRSESCFKSTVDMMIESPVAEKFSPPSRGKKSSTKNINSNRKKTDKMKAEGLEKEFRQKALIGNLTPEKTECDNYVALHRTPSSKVKTRKEQMTTSPSVVNLLPDRHSKNDSPNSGLVNVPVIESNMKHLPGHEVMAWTESGGAQAAVRDKEKTVTSVVLRSQLNPSPMHHQGDVVGARMSDPINGKHVPLDNGSDTLLQDDFDDLLLNENSWLQFAFRLSSSDGKEEVTKSCSSSVVDTSTEIPVSEKNSLSSMAKEMSSPAKNCMLFWLLGSGTLVEKEKVYCLRKSSNTVYSGLVTRDGIRCDCCKEVLSLLKFQAHADRSLISPWENICLLSGKTLTACMSEAWEKVKAENKIGFQMISTKNLDNCDDTCGICADGGDLISCYGCLSSFHKKCLVRKALPENICYCPYCICKLCMYADQVLGVVHESSSLLKCQQCGCNYHQECATGETSYSFCGTSCKQMANLLSSMIGIPHLIGGGFSWTLLKRIEEDEVSSGERFSSIMEYNAKLSMAFSVMNDCFTPLKDERTGLDQICQAIYNCGSNLKRLNYEGFYTLILEKDEEIISAATLRFHGTKLSEMPFIGTQTKFRRQGMCRLLLKATEEILSSLSVEKLIVPAIPEQLWKVSFLFKHLELSDKEEIRNLSLVLFPSIDLLKKTICSSDAPGPKDHSKVIQEISDLSGSFSKDVNIGENESNDHPNSLPVPHFKVPQRPIFKAPSIGTTSKSSSRPLLQNSTIPSFFASANAVRDNGSESPRIARNTWLKTRRK